MVACACEINRTGDYYTFKMSTSWHSQAVTVTGSIGSGKSTVCSILKELGAAVISADELARKAVLPGSQALKEIVLTFGPEVLNPNGSLNRTKLAQIVFSESNKRKTLEKITHPVIKALAEKAFHSVKAQNPPLIVYDCPLLFETGLDKAGFKKIILVAADEEASLERIVARDHITEAEARARLASQMPLAEKRKGADIVIENSGTMEELREKVVVTFKELTKKRTG